MTAVAFKKSVTEQAVSNRLSYSQVRLYGECSKKFEYSYIHKLREKSTSGALLFGSAVDKAMEACLKNNQANDKEVFDEIWKTQAINGRPVSLPDSLLVNYSASDFDYDLLDIEDLRFLSAKGKELLPSLSLELEESVEAMYKACRVFKSQKAFRTFKEEENRFLNLCNWHSLRQKGHLMLDAHRQFILPRIKKIIGTQVKINLDNGAGDSLLGYADLVAEWEDGTTIVFDYKTSSIEYAEDSVRTSAQLSIYGHALDIHRAGYVVFRKGIKKNTVKVCGDCGFDGSGARHKTCSSEASGKRCGGAWVETFRPEVDIQIIIDDIPPRTEEIVLDNIEAVNKAIKAGIFTRNFSACVQPWGKCPFYSLCYEDKMGDLEVYDKDKASS